jgi:hypothetical protein
VAAVLAVEGQEPVLAGDGIHGDRNELLISDLNDANVEIFLIVGK